MKHTDEVNKGTARVQGGAGTATEGISLTGPVERRKVLTMFGVGVAALWCSALTMNGKHKEAASPNKREEEPHRDDNLTEGFVVSGTREAEAFLRSRGDCLVKQQAGTRYILHIKTEQECFQDLMAEAVLAIALPRALSPEELWSVARRNWRLVQIPVFVNKDAYTRNRERTAPQRDPDMFYLYLREDMLAGRPRVQAFAQICQFGGLSIADAG